MGTKCAMLCKNVLVPLNEINESSSCAMSLKVGGHGSLSHTIRSVLDYFCVLVAAIHVARPCRYSSLCLPLALLSSILPVVTKFN